MSPVDRRYWIKISKKYTGTWPHRHGLIWHDRVSLVLLNCKDSKHPIDAPVRRGIRAVRVPPPCRPENARLRNPIELQEHSDLGPPRLKLTCCTRLRLYPPRSLHTHPPPESMLLHETCTCVLSTYCWLDTLYHDPKSLLS